ncbi:MAG: hypothetical protein LR015_07695 [Verrucomicrobia bacterium]|nr:hypothetical protein [Verrucomicrobiota bacterium]
MSAAKSTGLRCLGAWITMVFAGVISVCGATLEVSLARVLNAFDRGAWQEAYALMETFEQVFGEEPEFLQPEVQNGWLARLGWAALASSEWQRAQQAFESWMERFTKPMGVRRMVLYGYAQSLEQLTEFELAIQAWEAYLQTVMDRPAVVDLAKLRMADLHAMAGNMDDALNTALPVVTAGATQQLREEAGLRSLRWQISEHRTEQLWEIWQLFPDPMQMAEPIAWSRYWLLAAEQMLRDGDAQLAWQLLRSLPDRERMLIGALRQREDWHSRLQRRESGIGSTRQDSMPWQQLHQNRLGRLEQQVSWLSAQVDFDARLQMMRGQAAFVNRRWYEAGFIWQLLSTDAAICEELRADAHYRWILALHARKDWELLESAVQQYRASYPNSAQLPAVLFTAADALHSQGRTAAALSLLAHLIEDFAEHPLLAFWEFSRGMILLSTGRWQDALPFFQRSAEIPSQFNIVELAQLWEALAWMEGDEHQRALAILSPLVTNLPMDHPQRAPALYHRARCLRAVSDSRGALRDCAEFINHYNDHPLIAETHVLAGELNQEVGRWAIALDHFKSIEPERGVLFTHAAFQVVEFIGPWKIGPSCELILPVMCCWPPSTDWGAARKRFNSKWSPLPSSIDLMKPGLNLLRVGSCWRIVRAAETQLNC